MNAQKIEIDGINFLLKLIEEKNKKRLEESDYFAAQKAITKLEKENERPFNTPRITIGR